MVNGSKKLGIASFFWMHDMQEREPYGAPFEDN